MIEGLLAPWHIIIIGLLVVVVFGSKRLPESARAIGQSMRILKSETRGLRDDDGTPSGAVQAAVVPPAGVTGGPQPWPAAPVGAGGPGSADRVARYDAFTGRPLDGTAARPE